MPWANCPGFVESGQVGGGGLGKEQVVGLAGWGEWDREGRAHGV